MRNSFGRAAAGMEGAFLMNGAAEVGTFPQLIEVAAKQKVPRIVFLSSLFASVPGTQIGKMHEEKENAIRRAGIRGYFSARGRIHVERVAVGALDQGAGRGL